jgi:hypothetical protein
LEELEALEWLFWLFLLVIEQVIISHVVVRPSMYLLLCWLESSCCVCGIWSWQIWLILFWKMNSMCLFIINLPIVGRIGKQW